MTSPLISSFLPTRLALVILLVLATGTLSLLSSAQSVAGINGTSPVEGGYYIYELFMSGSAVPPQKDGQSGVGVMCRPGSQMGVSSTDQVYFSDMCGSGSTVRLVNWDGIHTIAGSALVSGFVNGNSTEARFSSFSQGSQLANGLCFAKDAIYLADTGNNVIRRVSPTSGETTTFISQNSQLQGLSLSYPISLSPYNHLENGTNLFISDTGNKRILFSPIENSTVPPLTLVKSGFQPGVISVSSNLSSLFYVSNTDVLNGMYLETNRAWEIGNSSCTGYISSLAIMRNDSHLFFFGEQNAVHGVYSFSTTENDSENETDNATDNTSTSTDDECGKLEFEWPYTAPIRSIATRNAYSYYILTNDGIYISSGKELYFPPVNALANRTNVLIGFPVAPLPFNSDCLLSEFYNQLMLDFDDSFGTKDYYIQFAPWSDRSLLVNGTMNVTSWCIMLADSVKSNDGSVLILSIYGPPNWSKEKILDSLAKSHFTEAKDYLDELYKNRLGVNASDGSQNPFCLLPCDDDSCYEYSATGKTYCMFRSGCDRFCIAGIVSGTSMAAALVTLVVLVILIPSNLFNAFFMVPII